MSDTTWGDVTEREVAIYALYESLKTLKNSGELEKMVIASVVKNYPNLSLTDKKKRSIIGHVDKNLDRSLKPLADSLKAYDYNV